MNLMRSFAEDPTSPLHRTLASLTILLDDYRTARQSLAAGDTVSRVVSQIHIPPPPPPPPPSPVIPRPPPPSPAKLNHHPISPIRAVSIPMNVHRVASPAVPSVPTPISASPGKKSSALRRKAFRPRKIVLSDINPSDLVPSSPTSGEALSDAPIANVLRDVEKSQKLAESISSRIMQGLPEGIDLEHMGNILTDLCDDPEMAHLFGTCCAFIWMHILIHRRE